MPTTRRRSAPWTAACLLIAACGGGDEGDGGSGGGGDGRPATPPTGAPGEPGGSDGAGGPVALGPLPSPPLTEPPGPDDEPVADDPALHTATRFDVVRETDALPPDPEAPALTEADFARGLPDPVIAAPPGLDPAANAAPFFAGLEANVRVAAGERVEIVFAPRDPDGGLPGMFPQALPEGASFDDNLDGTKTLDWLPLESDVGVASFTAVAIDPEVPAYRTSQTVLIAVDPPADPAAVPNVAPTLGDVPAWTVRAGDPATLELAGIDRNGTVPTLELVGPPGASLVPHPYREGVSVLRLVPEVPGPLEIEVRVRDGADPSLARVEAVSLDVVAPSAFALPGERLRDLAAARDVAFGFAASPEFYRRPDGALYAELAGGEFAILTHESSLKMDALNPLPGRYEFADADNLVAFARSAGMAVRGHPLVWYRQLPGWVGRTPIGEREGHMREYVARVVGRYADEIDLWDVVNEPLAEDGTLRESIWSEGVGERYIDVAFAQARAGDPDATLVLNEFDAGVEGPKRDGLLALVDRLLEREVPIDAVGFQLHLFASFDRFDELAESFAEIASRDLDVHVTELDVSLTDETDEIDQAAVYERIVGLCLATTRCRTIQTWGFTDRYSFRSRFEPLPLDRAYRAKPAYRALQRALGGG